MDRVLYSRWHSIYILGSAGSFLRCTPLADRDESRIRRSWNPCFERGSTEATPDPKWKTFDSYLRGSARDPEHRMAALKMEDWSFST